MSVCTPQTPFSVYFPPQVSSFCAARSDLHNTFSFTIFSEQNSIPKFCTAFPMTFLTQNSSGSGWKCIIKEFWLKILNNFCCIKGSFCGSTQRFSGRAAGTWQLLSRRMNAFCEIPYSVAARILANIKFAGHSLNLSELPKGHWKLENLQRDPTWVLGSCSSQNKSQKIK